MTAPNEPKKRVDSFQAGQQEISCEHCHGLFLPKTSRHKFCSTACCWKQHGIGQATLQSRPCDTCGTPFKQHRSGQRFCSEACRTKPWPQTDHRLENPALQDEERRG